MRDPAQHLYTQPHHHQHRDRPADPHGNAASAARLYLSICGTGHTRAIQTQTGATAAARDDRSGRAVAQSELIKTVRSVQPISAQIKAQITGNKLEAEIGTACCAAHLSLMR